MKGYMALFTATVAQVGGLLLTKRALLNSHGLSILSIQEILSVLLNPYTMMGVLCYCFSLVFWLIAISNLELSIAYPVGSSAGYILIALFSHYTFSETLNTLKMIGIAVITVGIILMFWGR